MDRGRLGNDRNDLRVIPSLWEWISLLWEWIGPLGVALVALELDFGALE